MQIATRTVRADDVAELATAFASWPKPRALFDSYAQRVADSSLDMAVASIESQLAGYLLIKRRSSYPPFLEAGIPEIADFNVIRSRQRMGIGTALMDEAERRVAQFSDIVGLGVGLYSDYGTAQRMYVRRGYLPDGAGVVLDGVPVPAGTKITLDDDPELMFTKQGLRSAVAADRLAIR